MSKDTEYFRHNETSVRSGLSPIGFVGLGIMGFPMMVHLVEAGYPVFAFVRRPNVRKKAQARGAEPVPDLRDLGQTATTLVLVLRDAPDVEDVLFGQELAKRLSPGTLVLDCTTLAPTAARDIARRLEELGIEYVDAPVSGGQAGAQQGNLAVMVGGTDEAVRRALPILETFGATIVHMGSVGSGQVTKACNQLIVAGTIELVAEALYLAARCGVPPAAVREALLGGFAGSRILERHGQRMLDGDFEPGFRMEMQLKDVRIVRETASSVAAPTPALDAVYEQVQRAADHPARRNLDHSALLLNFLGDEDLASVEARGGLG